LGGSKKAEEQLEDKRKKRVIIYTNQLFLNNNDIRSLTGLSSILDNVMYFPDRLQSLNLSHNYLEKIDSELLNFPNLKCLYLHGNYISNLEEVRKLGKLHTLQILTLYANSIA